MNQKPAPVEARPAALDERRIKQLVDSVRRRAPLDAVVLLERESDEIAGEVLSRLDAQLAIRILAYLPGARAEQLAPLIPSVVGEQWTANLAYADGTVGRMMEPAGAVFRPDVTVGETVETLRPFARENQLVYVYVTSEEGRLLGVVAMRELLFAESGERLADVMVDRPFYFRAEAPVEEALRAVLARHYPLYPICDNDGLLLGVVQGYLLSEKYTLELSAQAGRSVGVEKEEHLGTSWQASLRMRQPWLQLNLLTAFVAGAVVGLFDETIERVVAVAAFLPVLAGQSGNTGCQALAVTLRGMTLNELKPGSHRALIAKEAMLGLCNGALVGITAAIGMACYATLSGNGQPLLLAVVVAVAMLGSCVASGVSGAVVPLVLRRFGANPATASTIFLTTATDVVSMGLLLGLTALFIA